MSRAGWKIEALGLGLALVLFVFGFADRGVAGGFDPGQRAAESRRVVTWNVGQELAHGAEPLRREEEAHVVERLRALAPDLVLLQELEDFDQIERLRAALGAEWSAAASSPGPSRKLAILTRGSGLERLRLPGVGGRAVGALVELEGRAWTVIGVHADAFSAEERNALLGHVRGLLDQSSGGASADGLRLLGGDFNIDLDRDKRRDLFTNNEHLDVETYNVLLERAGGRGGLVDAAVDAGPTAEPDRRLDYLLVDPQHARVVQAGPWRGQRAVGMDHDPLVSDLLLR